jgi:hypothetical protein
MRAVGTWLPLAFVVVVAAFAFVRFTWTGWAGTDSLTLVETSRVGTWSDLLPLTARPVMDRTTFAQGELVYRPFVTLSFAADSALWGVNAVGYHLTNLALHILTTLCVWALLRGLGLSRSASLIGSALFALHPATVASVPVIARRDSLVPVAAFTASMALLVRRVRAPEQHGWPWTSAALILFAVAVFSKESAFAAFLLVPLMIFGARSCSLTTRDCLRLLAPYGLLVVIALAARLAVLGSLGGYQGVPIASVDLGAYRAVLAGYSRFLFWPLGEVFPTSSSAWVAMLAAALAALLALATMLPRRVGVVLALGCAWVAVFALFHAAVKTFSGAWLIYFPLVGVSLIAGAIVDLLRLPRLYAARAILALGLATWAIAVLRTSPLLVRYGDWAIVGSITDRYLTAARDCMRDAPDGAALTLVGLPSALDAPRASSDLLAPTVLADYTVEAALRLTYPNRHFTVSTTSSVPIAPDSANSVVTTCAGSPAARQLTAS